MTRREAFRRMVCLAGVPAIAPPVADTPEAPPLREFKVTDRLSAERMNEIVSAVRELQEKSRRT